MLGNYLCLKYEGEAPTSFVDVKALSDKHKLPKVKFTHDGASMKSGLKYDRLMYGHRNYKNSKVVFVGRDVRDTLVSAYFQATKRINVYDGDIGEFAKSELYGVDKILSFYKLWHEAYQESRSFMYTSYELMHENAHRELKRVLNFMNIGVDEELVDKAVASCSFSNMKTMEKEGEGTSSAFQPADKSDSESYKTRKGKVGGYVDHLSEEDVGYIQKRAQAYGIDLGNPWMTK